MLIQKTLKISIHTHSTQTHHQPAPPTSPACPRPGRPSDCGPVSACTGLSARPHRTKSAATKTNSWQTGPARTSSAGPRCNPAEPQRRRCHPEGWWYAAVPPSSLNSWRWKTSRPPVRKCDRCRRTGTRFRHWHCSWVCKIERTETRACAEKVKPNWIDIIGAAASKRKAVGGDDDNDDEGYGGSNSMNNKRHRHSS